MNKSIFYLALTAALLTGCIPGSVNDQYACVVPTSTPTPVIVGPWVVPNLAFSGTSACVTVSETASLLIQRQETFNLTTSSAGGSFYTGSWVIRYYSSDPSAPNNCLVAQNSTTIAFAYQLNGTNTVNTLGHQQAILNIFIVTSGGAITVTDATATNLIGICGKTNFSAGTTAFPNQFGALPESCLDFFGWSHPLNLSAATRPYLHQMTANYIDGGAGLIDYTRSAPETSYRSVPYYSGDDTGLKIFR